MALTDAWLMTNSGKRTDTLREVTDGAGLSVRINPTGKIVFQMRYVFDGNRRRLDLGIYPELDLRAARAENERLRGELKKGHDPKAVRLLERQPAFRADTIEDLFRRWHERFCQSKEPHAEEILRSFELYVFPTIGTFPPAHVTLENWTALLMEAATVKSSMATMLFNKAKRMLAWAESLRLVPTNVLAGPGALNELQVAKSRAKRSRPAEEVTQILDAVERSRIAKSSKRFLKLCLSLVISMESSQSAKARRATFDNMT